MQPPMPRKQQAAATFLMHAAALAGRVSMLGFTVFLLTGPFHFIDIGLPPMAWMVWDTLLSFLFFTQHSVMIRRRFRTRLAASVPAYSHDALFCLISGLTLMVVMVGWQPSGISLLVLQPPWRWLARCLFAMGAAGLAWGVLALKGFDPYGEKSIKARLTGKPVRPHPFTVKGPYKLMRHPLYFFVLLLIWSCPDLTADRLLFNILFSAWIYLGSLLEERDLVADFGDDYRDYQKRVPMLIPYKKKLNQGER